MPVSHLEQSFKRIGIVGAGNMGSMMALAFSERGIDVSIWDMKRENVDETIKKSREITGTGKVDGFHDINHFTDSLEGRGKQKLFLFSSTYGGGPTDSVLGMIREKLTRGDIIIDGGNENYRCTERRQRECAEIGVHWVGMGVSGGYESARHGPSLSPGGDTHALNLIMPLLELFAAKDPKSGRPCVAPVGPAGSGHFVKMVHNGIEVGMLSTIAEACSMLYHGLGLEYDEIENLFETWNSRGELRNTYLLKIGVDILHARRTADEDQKHHGSSTHGGYVLNNVLDKVVQDDYGSEGTPSWCVMDSPLRHVSTPTLAAAYYLRVASGNRVERLPVARNLQITSPKPMENIEDRESLLENLRRAVYCSFLVAFCQGLELIARASEDEGWNIDLGTCLQIWNVGCIVQAEGITDLLQEVIPGDMRCTNLKLIKGVAHELHKNFNALREVVIEGLTADQYLPAMSATLEYLKYEGGTILPSQFMEGQMDFFGGHSHEKPGVDGDGKAIKKGGSGYGWL
ncbi:hypothetical protein FE257_006160 [Aspergillus nanangensis]|uniref:phosphogluconate dehydrogenase (NADP(+)-dependent, decarboxylating) n=1 Tax=Aspergillus nanangensis TaxID=2582783 RepID=A0AAD4GW80_ASPNN|nr:hypothetical protein FE257_006160 [Aspergillus nanangensis]